MKGGRKNNGRCKALRRQGVRCNPFNPWVGTIPWRRKWQPTPVFLPGESHRQRNPGRLQSMGSQRVGHNWATKDHHCQFLVFGACAPNLSNHDLDDQLGLPVVSSSFSHLSREDEILKRFSGASLITRGLGGYLRSSLSRGHLTWCSLAMLLLQGSMVQGIGEL